MSCNGIILNGATAVGKTELSIKLAQKLNCEIISADSTQIYKELDILTAKVTKEEMQGIKHHLIDFLEIEQDYSVYDFKKNVETILNNLNSQPVIIVGGTGLYTNVLNKGLAIMPEKSSELRKELESKSLCELKSELEKIDYETFEKIDKNNKVRLVRALEVILLSGKKYSDIIKENNKGHNYSFFNVFLTRDRMELYNRINKRVDLMLDMGAIIEGKKIYEKYGKTMYNIKAIGYRQMYKYFENMISYEEMVDEIKQESRNYAKRQITWFKNKGYYEINLSEISVDDAVKLILKKYEEGKCN